MIVGRILRFWTQGEGVFLKALSFVLPRPPVVRVKRRNQGTQGMQSAGKKQCARYSTIIRQSHEP